MTHERVMVERDVQLVDRKEAFFHFRFCSQVNHTADPKVFQHRQIVVAQMREPVGSKDLSPLRVATIGGSISTKVTEIYRSFESNLARTGRFSHGAMVAMGSPMARTHETGFPQRAIQRERSCSFGKSLPTFAEIANS